MDREEALKLLRGGREGIAEWNRRKPLESFPSLEDAHLDRTDLRKGDFRHVNLRGADLVYANLFEANLSGADLSGANLSHADLRWAELSETELDGASLLLAHCMSTRFIDVDLSKAKYIDNIVPAGPSPISIGTLIRSRGQIPESFLRGCGLPDAWITNLPALIGSLEPIQFFSCFISYSTADEDFATRVHNDFQAAGIRCWKWDHDAVTGRNLWGEIDQAIRVHDKLVLIASESSLTSPAVNREIERAIVQEDDREKRKQRGEFDGDINVLFPVRLDDFLFKGWQHERKVDVTKKVIADARNWDKKRGVYKKVLDRLIRDLKAQK